MFRGTAALALIVALSGCERDLAYAPCPCVGGEWQCCATLNHCIKADDICPASADTAGAGGTAGALGTAGAGDAAGALGTTAAGTVGIAASGTPQDERNPDATPRALKGCAVDASVSSRVAPDGYYTNGASVCTASGRAHLFHGVHRPSLESNSLGEWDDKGGIPRSDFDEMASWHANVVRLSLNQDFWLSGSKLYDPAYQDTVDRAVQDAEAAGLDVILDLHWSDRGDRSANADQQPMADSNSKEFWQEVATKYKGDGHVLFELYNEPHDIDWSVWLAGGKVDEYQAVGMQELYDTVRRVGADNLVIAGGVDWGFDLSGVAGQRIQGYNIMYATHPFGPPKVASQWDRKFGYVAAQDVAPVIASAFADWSPRCDGAWDSAVVKYADARQISWTAWAWWAGDCAYPSLISDWEYTPTLQGAAIKDALLSYPYEPAGVPSKRYGAGAGQ